MNTITCLIDENISGLSALLDAHNHQGARVNIISTPGRNITNVISSVAPDALFVRSVTPINKNLPYLPRFIASATLGLDHIDTLFLQKNNISFAHAPKSSKHSVAQYVIAAMFATNSVHFGSTTLGIIGLGAIGSTLCQYAKSLGLTILGYDPFLPKSVVNNTNLDTLLQKSDIITIHTPLSFEGAHKTHHMVDAAFLAKIKPNALLINAARGKIVDEAALMDALCAQKIRVVLDVFYNEPRIKKALLDKLVIATPHIAGYTKDAKLRGAHLVYQAFCQKFNLPMLTDLSAMVPNNTPKWSVIKDALLQNDTTLLTQVYDIKQDDAMLKNICTSTEVLPNDFDAMRKHYHLKREMAFDEDA